MLNMALRRRNKSPLTISHLPNFNNRRKIPRLLPTRSSTPVKARRYNSCNRHSSTQSLGSQQRSQMVTQVVEKAARIYWEQSYQVRSSMIRMTQQPNLQSSHSSHQKSADEHCRNREPKARNREATF